MVAHGAFPVAYSAQEASFQLSQEIVYEQPALVYEANGSQPGEYVQPLALLTCAAPAADARNTTYSHVPESAEDCGGAAGRGTFARLWMHLPRPYGLRTSPSGRKTVSRKRKTLHGDRVC